MNIILNKTEVLVREESSALIFKKDRVIFINVIRNIIKAIKLWNLEGP